MEFDGFYIGILFQIPFSYPSIAIYLFNVGTSMIITTFYAWFSQPSSSQSKVLRESFLYFKAIVIP